VWCPQAQKEANGVPWSCPRGLGILEVLMRDELMKKLLGWHMSRKQERCGVELVINSFSPYSYSQN